MIPAKTIIPTLLAAALLSAACTGPPPQHPAPTACPTAASAPAAASVASAWQALREGRLDEARRGFADGLNAPGLREEALAGLLRIALASADEEAITGLLRQLPAQPEQPRLLLAAARAQLRAISPQLEPALLERACALGDSQDLETAIEAESICASLALRRTFPQLRRCVAGCGADQQLPLRLIGAQPEQSFVVDTGASTSVITQALAAQLGLSLDPATRYRIRAAGKLISAQLAAVALELGELRVADVPVAVIDLPFVGIGGLISTHDSFPQRRATFDFRAFTLSLHTTAAPPSAEAVALPLTYCQGNPTLLATVGDRPPRPLIVDTGASNTTLATTLDALGTPLPRGQETTVSGAGEVQLRSFQTTAEVPAKAGALSWTMAQPTLVERPAKGDFQSVEGMGLLGMDMLMGRILTIDPLGRAIRVSKEAQLAPWEPGSTARFDLVGSHFKGRKISVTERVVERRAASVVLEIVILDGKDEDRFRIELTDSWKSRGTWQITRPVSALWLPDGKEWKNEDPKAYPKRWAALMPGFKTDAKDTTIELATLELGSETLACTQISVSAQRKDGPARLHIWECPKSPWRTTRIELRAGEELIWGFHRVAAE